MNGYYQEQSDKMIQNGFSLKIEKNKKIATK